MRIIKKILIALASAIKVIIKNPFVATFWILLAFGIYTYVTWKADKDKDEDEKEIIAITENVITDLKEIGEWEFYNITTEELVDTTITGLISEKQLTLIYKGTLRLGINFKEVQDDWFYSPHRDSVFCLLPKVKLLDENFINETSTRVLHENGTFEPNVRAEMTRRAYRQMKERNLKASNYTIAQKSAEQGITQYLANFGYKYIEVMWKE